MVRRSGSIRRRLWPATAAVVAILVCACGSQATGTPGATATAAPTATPAPTPTPVSYADTLRIGVDVGLYRSWQPYTELGGVPALTFGRLVYSGLYRYDGRDSAVPDLADGPCFVPGSDDKVIRCRLVETTFHDGTPLTADHVAYSYQVMSRPVMVESLGAFKEVRVVDARTVDFVLSKVDPLLLTVVLPLIPIFSRQSIEEAVAVFDEATKDLTAEGLDALADTINDEINRDPPVCSEDRLAEAEAIYRKLGYTPQHADFLKENGEFDVCAALGMAAFNLDTSTNSGGGSIGYALSQTGIDRVAGIVGQMAWGRPDIFVGTGPYRYVSQDADAVHFEAFAGYHAGVAATKHVDFVRATGDGSDLQAGAVDILARAGLGVTLKATAATYGLRTVPSPADATLALTFNVRDGRLFSDIALRRALQLCIDLPRVVDTVTGGAGTPIYGPVMPGSWGADPKLQPPVRDPTTARLLIEGAGWKKGADGVYEKDGVRLAAKIVVPDYDELRDKAADLIANQAADCGMDLASALVSAMPFEYPHFIPGTETPFDLMIPRFANYPDPDQGSDTFTTSQISSEKNPGGNLGGFSDPAFDRLVAVGRATYDQAERVKVYRQAQEELASQVPAIFLWAGGWNSEGYDALRTAVATVDGPLDLSVPNWAWQPERLVVLANP